MVYKIIIAIYVITKKICISGRCSVLSTLDLASNEYCSMVYKSVHVYCPEFICQALCVVFCFVFFPFTKHQYKSAHYST